MTTVLLCIIIGLLIYMIWTQKENEEKDKVNKSMDYHEILPMYLMRNCEIRVKKPLFSIDIAYCYKGTLLDIDDEWLMLKKQEKKKEIIKIIRISNIKSVKEIISHS